MTSSGFEISGLASSTSALMIYGSYKVALVIDLSVTGLLPTGSGPKRHSEVELHSSRKPDVPGLC